ncbi:MAG: hypothetical protein V3V14_03035 [Saprospiraceae bacterium]
MNPLLKNILAVIVGWIAGSIVNMGLIQLGGKIMPIEGLDPNDMESYAEIIPSLEPKFFLFPFLAHALGTLVGAIVAGLIAANNKMKFSLFIGFFFLIGGVVISFMLPGAMWFTIIDLIFAYIPMAWLGGLIALKIVNSKSK